jgi:glycerophosphoryl diester phosphodiesterase
VTSRPLVVAHRTCPLDASENSIAGIARAAADADMVELDVRRTRDDVPVLMHDRTAWSTAARPVPVIALTTEQARRLRLRRSDEPVPTLGDALHELPDGLGLTVDVKHAFGHCRRRVRRARDLVERVAIWSERRRALVAAAHGAPEIETALLRDATTPRGLCRFLDDAVAIRARAISAQWSVVSRELVARTHGRGLRVFSWCETGTGRHDKLDGLVTQWPAAVRASLRRTA